MSFQNWACLLVTIGVVLFSTACDHQVLPVVATIASPTASVPTRVNSPVHLPTPTLHNTPQPQVIPLPTVVALPMTDVVELEQPLTNAIAVDESYVYWTTDQEPGSIFRYPLTGGMRETIATTQFPNGSVGVVRPIRSGEWLLFVDAQYPVLNTPYIFRAKNVHTGEEQIVLDSRDGKLSLPFIDAEESRIVWTLTEVTDDPNCTEGVLALYDLQDNHYLEIDRACIQDSYMWVFARISGDNIVVEQDLPDSKGGGNNIFFYNLASGQFSALTSDGQSSIADISGKWIAWKDAPRFAEAQRSVLYNLETGERQIIEIGYNGPRLLNERWIYWELLPLSPIYFYDLEAQELYLIASSGANQAFNAMATDGRTIAWWRNLDFEHTNPDGVLEWRSVPQ